MPTSMGSVTTGAHAQYAGSENALASPWDTVLRKASEFGSDAKNTFDTIIKQASNAQADSAELIKSDLRRTVECFARALEDLVSNVAPNDQTIKQKAARVEATKILAMTPDELKALGADAKVVMLKTLLAPGVSVGDVRKAQIALYKSVYLSPGLVIRDNMRGDKVANDLHGNKELRSAKERWEYLSNEEKVGYLKIILASHSKRLGIQQPDVEIEFKGPDKGGLEGAHYDPNTNKIYLNMDRASQIQDFPTAVATIIHENTHCWQYGLVKQLKDGSLKKGDENYAEALLYAENFGLGYVTAQESFEGYRTQPIEAHAFFNGSSIAKKIIDGL